MRNNEFTFWFVTGIEKITGPDFVYCISTENNQFIANNVLVHNCDSMTDDAQQALRRTMEKYSPNTRFVISANYSSRIIEPIQSRCAVFRFARLGDEEIMKIVEKIEEKEGLKADDKARKAIVYTADGDARKAINVLQGTAILGNKISEEDVFKVSSRARPKEIAVMVEQALAGKFVEARKQLDELMVRYGMSGEDVITQIYKEVVSSSIPDKQKLLIVDRIAEYNYRMVEGANERIQLEALLAQLALRSEK